MLPQDSFMLLSVVNTKLRDEYSSLADLCEDMDEDRDVITQKLASIGYTYDEEENAFKRQ